MDHRPKVKQPPGGVVKMTNVTPVDSNRNDKNELLYSTPYADPRDVHPVPRPRSYVDSSDSNSRKSLGKQVSLTGVDNGQKRSVVNRSVSQEVRNDSKSGKSMGLNHSYSLQSDNQIDTGPSDSSRNTSKGKRASDSVLVTSITPISNRKPMPLPNSKESTSTPVPATRKSKVVLGDYTQPPDSITSEWAKAPTPRPDEYSEPFELLGVKNEDRDIARENAKEPTAPSNAPSDVYVLAKNVDVGIKKTENTGGVQPGVKKKLSSSRSKESNRSTSSDNILNDLSIKEVNNTQIRNQCAESISPVNIASSSSAEPVYQSNYEAPWDSEKLQKTLEEKAKKAERLGQKKSPTQFKSPPELPDLDMQSSYEEPWDTPARKKAFADRIKKASCDMSHTVLPQAPVNKDTSSVFQEGDTYEAPWDLKPESKALSRILSGGVPEEFEDTKPEFAPVEEGDEPSRQSSTYKTIAKEKNPYTEVLVGESIDPAVKLENQSWYHGSISRIEAEQLLNICKHGSYLVRASETQKNAFSLSLKSTNGLVAHLRISFKDGYILGENSKPFRTVPSMIDHYTYHKLPIKGLEHTTLAHPIPVDTL